METKLDYELVVKGRKAEVGSELWLDNGGGKLKEVTVSKISIFNFQDPQIRLKDKNNKYYFFRIDDLGFIDKCLFWEKPTIYQLPDTDGNLSEVKIGQLVWSKWHYKTIESFIYKFEEGNILIKEKKHSAIFVVENKTGKLIDSEAFYATTNKPHRDFSGCMDWSHAPKEAIEWRVTVDGYAFWYSNAYCERRGLDYDYDCGMYYISAGYRQDLLNEDGVVEDWEYSLVKRPKDV